MGFHKQNGQNQAFLQQCDYRSVFYLILRLFIDHCFSTECIRSAKSREWNIHLPRFRGTLKKRSSGCYACQCITFLLYSFPRFLPFPEYGNKPSSTWSTSLPLFSFSLAFSSPFLSFYQKSQVVMISIGSLPKHAPPNLNHSFYT